MGLFGGGNSKTSTSNTDNSVINDYANAQWDNGVEGNYNNNTGTINAIDPGAFDLASQVVDRQTDGLGHLADSIRSGASDAFEFSNGVARDALSGMRSVTGDAMTLADGTNMRMAGLTETSFELADSVNQRTLDTAMSIHDTTLSQIDMGNDLALALANNARQQSGETNQALTDGYEQMMQFTESFSRSDGAAVAKTNMQTVGVIAVALVLGAYILRGKK